MQTVKTNIISAFILTALVSIFSCKEVGPNINLHGNPNAVSDTTYIESPAQAPGAKNVVVEDFSGVECTNCPAGHAAIDTLQMQYPGRIVAVVYHPINILGRPYPYSLQNLEDTGSTNLLAYLVDAGLEPEAAIDRETFSCGVGYTLMQRTCWSGAVGEEIGLTPPVNIVLGSSYNPATRNALITVTLHYTQNVTQLNNLTVELTEDSIVTAQLNGNFIDTFYVHNEVFRDFVTTAYSPYGQTLDSTLVAGTVIRNVYSYTISAAHAAKWNPAHMNVVAFVQQPSNKLIVQGAVIRLE
jgi:Outer membrane protein Omp28